MTSNVKADLSNLSQFIKGDNEVSDFILRFEQKAGVRAIMNAFNMSNKYNHLFNSETSKWNNNISSMFGGWLTNNFMTTNWVFGNEINSNSKNILKNRYEVIMISDSHFFEIDKEEESEEEFSRLKFIDQYIVGFENGYKKTIEEKIKFYENLIAINNSL